MIVTSSEEKLLEAIPGAKPSGRKRPPRFNLAPSQDAPAVRNDGQLTLDWLRWGLIPHWARDPAIGNRLINARAETLAEKPSFRDALRRRRCVIPIDGFYEWRSEPGRRGKTPMLIRRRDRQPFAVAGLWETWRDPAGLTVLTCTVITTTPNELMAPIHERMPVILPTSACGAWLDPAEAAAADLAGLLVPCPAADLEAFAVTPRVNSPAHDDPDCLAPAPVTGELF